jgi:hypothetical protein
MHGNINVFRFYAFRLYAIFLFFLVLDGLFFAQVLIQALDWFDGCSMLFYELGRPKLAFLVGCWVTGFKMVIIMVNGVGALSCIPWWVLHVSEFLLSKNDCSQYHVLLLEYAYSPMRNYARHLKAKVSPRW